MRTDNTGPTSALSASEGNHALCDPLESDEEDDKEESEHHDSLDFVGQGDTEIDIHEDVNLDAEVLKQVFPKTKRKPSPPRHYVTR